MTDSGQITIVTAGTAVQGPATGGLHVAVKALSGNVRLVYIGNDSAGDVTSANGFELAAGDGVVVRKSLDAFLFDAANDGDKLCWLKTK